MKDLQKSGGVAALYLAAAYLTGIVIFFFVLDYPNMVDPAQKAAMVVGNQALMYVTNILMYVVFGVFLVILTLALYERLKTGATALMQIATAFGLIWAGAVIASGMTSNAGVALAATQVASDPAQAASTWSMMEAVANSLGGGNGELLGGLWTLLVSWAALRSGGLPKALSFLGVMVGGVGILSTIPPLVGLIGMFGLSQVVWFVWLGAALLYSPKRNPLRSPSPSHV